MISIVRIVGLSELVLGLAHAFLWRWFGWSRELVTLSPLTARVFAVHTFFVAFLLSALGLLELLHPELLLDHRPLARLVLGFATVLWCLRALAQPLVFDPVLLPSSTWRTPLRIVALLGFGGYALVHAWMWLA